MPQARNTPFATVFDQIATYIPERGHGAPFVPVKVEGGQGITLTLPLKDKEQADIYIERVQKEDGSFKWQINISPDAMDIKAVVEITDMGEIQVMDESKRWHVNVVPRK